MCLLVRRDVEGELEECRCITPKRSKNISATEALAMTETTSHKPEAEYQLVNTSAVKHPGLTQLDLFLAASLSTVRHSGIQVTRPFVRAEAADKS